MQDQPLGSDLTEPIEADRPPRRFFSTRELLIVCSIVVVLFLMIVPNFLKARARGQLTACKSNLKNLATALEMYSSEHKGRYPERLDQLIPGKYLKQIPTWPSRTAVWGRKLAADHDYTYSVTQPDFFSMCCRGDHANAYRGFDADPHNFPRYNSQEGLIDHP